MASFSLLPNELVREVARHVMPEDIESFSLISRNVYREALPLLEEHRELKNRYRAFDIIEKAEFYGGRPKWHNWGETSTSNCFAGDSFSSLLIDVLQHRRVALYIREIRHAGWFPCWESEVPDPLIQPHMRTPYTKTQFTMFKEALPQHVLPAKLDSWIQELESGNEDPVISLLLILLPNIRSMKLEGAPSMRQQRLRDVIVRIKEDCKVDTPVLHRLERVNMQHYDEAHLDMTRSIDFAFFLTLSSLKSLHGQSIFTGNDSRPFSSLPPDSSSVTELSLTMCNFSLNQLEDLFRGLKSLKKFCFVHEDSEFNFATALWDPAGICKLLLEHAKQTLEVLVLRSKDKPIVLLEPIASLRDFNVLKELTLSLPLFEIGQSWDWWAYPSRHLAHELPESLQEINFQDIEIGHYRLQRDAVRDLVHCKPQRLPRLEKVCLCARLEWEVEVPSGVVMNLRVGNSDETVGIELCFVDAE